MAVELTAVTKVVTPNLARAVQLATREAVNASLLAITQDARARVRTVLGPEQRMSRVTTRKRGDRTSRVTTATIEKGGTRINPYFRQADSTTRPVGLVGARGPAHLLEHSRRGGYDVRPHRRTGNTAAVSDLANLQAEIFGRSRAQAQVTAARVARPGAIRTGVAGTGKNTHGDYGRVRPGPIFRPAGGPIAAAFRAAPNTMNDLATKAVQDTLDRTVNSIGGGIGADLRRLAVL